MKDFGVQGFAENKDLARKIREEGIFPFLAEGYEVVLDCTGVNGMTQSFAHAMLAAAIRKFGELMFENMYFDDVDEDVKQIISIVYRYMQESMS